MALLLCIPLIAILPFVSRLSVTLLISFFALFLLGLTIGQLRALLGTLARAARGRIPACASNGVQRECSRGRPP